MSFDWYYKDSQSSTDAFLSINVIPDSNVSIKRYCTYEEFCRNADISPSLFEKKCMDFSKSAAEHNVDEVNNFFGSIASFFENHRKLFFNSKISYDTSPLENAIMRTNLFAVMLDLLVNNVQEVIDNLAWFLASLTFYFPRINKMSMQNDLLTPLLHYFVNSQFNKITGQNLMICIVNMCEFYAPFDPEKVNITENVMQIFDKLIQIGCDELSISKYFYKLLKYDTIDPCSYIPIIQYLDGLTHKNGDSLKYVCPSFSLMMSNEAVVQVLMRQSIPHNYLSSLFVYADDDQSPIRIAIYTFLSCILEHVSNDQKRILIESLNPYTFVKDFRSLDERVQLAFVTLVDKAMPEGYQYLSSILDTQVSHGALIPDLLCKAKNGRIGLKIASLKAILSVIKDNMGALARLISINDAPQCFEEFLDSSSEIQSITLQILTAFLSFERGEKRSLQKFFDEFFEGDSWELLALLKESGNQNLSMLVQRFILGARARGYEPPETDS